MNGRTAGLLLLVACAVVAELLVTGAISRGVGGALFALVLVVLGVVSGGFRRG